MVEVPRAAPLTRPPELTVAAAPLLVLQVAVLVTSCVVLSEKWAVAVSCSVPPTWICEVVGATVTDCSVGACTVRLAVPEIAPEVA